MIFSNEKGSVCLENGCLTRLLTRLDALSREDRIRGDDDEGRRPLFLARGALFPARWACFKPSPLRESSLITAIDRSPPFLSDPDTSRRAREDYAPRREPWLRARDRWRAESRLIATRAVCCDDLASSSPLKKSSHRRMNYDRRFRHSSWRDSFRRTVRNGIGTSRSRSRRKS